MKNTNFTIDSVKEMIGNRTVYIYGVNLEGIGICRMFLHHGITVGGFLDTRFFENNEWLHKKVIPPSVFFKNANPEELFIIIGTKSRELKKEIINQCLRHNFFENQGYANAIELCSYMPTIETAGVCNLRCLSCSVGTKGFRQGGLMTLDNYNLILKKMISEIPLLNSVCLYLWGEPLLNPHLADIIKSTADKGIACEISTNLNQCKNLEPVIKATPDVLIIPCSGIGENYELTHTGGNWNQFKSNLYKLREYIDNYNSQTIVKIAYHLYTHNMSEDYSTIELIAEELGFYFMPIVANLFIDEVHAYAAQNKPLPPTMLKANKFLWYPVDEQLKYAYQMRDKYCPHKKAFPTVRWNSSVVLCCNSPTPTISDNYLHTSLKKLDSLRFNHHRCNTCKKLGLHRFFDNNGTVISTDNKRIVTR